MFNPALIEISKKAFPLFSLEKQSLIFPGIIFNMNIGSLYLHVFINCYSFKMMPSTNEFDLKASGWDENPVHHARSEAIAREMLRLLPVKKGMNALDFGSGTGILSFLLKDSFNEIFLMDSSSEMVKVAKKKIEAAGIKNLNPFVFDLEHEIYSDKSFDVIFTQMVLHHINDIENLFAKFYKMLNPNGFIAIADLYTEDGSFHGEGFSGHNGFDIEELSATLGRCNFHVIASEQCFIINKKISEEETRQFSVFLIIANRR
jgi:tRNA (cmo5U34)-methyltransferase